MLGASGCRGGDSITAAGFALDFRFAAGFGCELEAAGLA
jgi:hypothetical protein